MPDNLSPLDIIRPQYEQVVRAMHPHELGRWPVLTGADTKTAGYKGWFAILLKHTANPTASSFSGLGELSRDAVGFDEINEDNLETVRERLLRHFRATPDDAVVLIPPSGVLLPTELLKMLARHEAALGIAKMKIFLSHKSLDKSLVRDFKATLEALGFDPWLDEDAMAAGAQLDRAILKGMQDSCAAVFFLTENFEDETFLATEINYAIDQQRTRPDQFAIITLVLGDDADNRPPVPGLLKPFVWKKPDSSLMALREIIRALPLRLGQPQWR